MSTSQSCRLLLFEKLESRLALSTGCDSLHNIAVAWSTLADIHPGISDEVAANIALDGTVISVEPSAGASRTDDLLGGPVYVVNGIWTHLNHFRDTLQIAADKFGLRVTGIYNATTAERDEKSLADIIESLANKLGLPTPAECTLSRLAKSNLDQGKHVRILAHSQGTIITANALQDIQTDKPESLKKLHVATIGKATCNWPEPGALGTLVHRKLAGDHVTHGFGTCRLTDLHWEDISRSFEHDFRRYLDVFGGAIRSDFGIVLQTALGPQLPLSENVQVPGKVTPKSERSFTVVERQEPSALSDVYVGLGLSTSTPGRISARGEQDLFRVHIGGNGPIKIEAGTPFDEILDSFVTIFDENMRPIASDDDTIGTDAQIWIDGHISQEIFVQVSGSANSIGSYILLVSHRSSMPPLPCSSKSIDCPARWDSQPASNPRLASPAPGRSTNASLKLLVHHDGLVGKRDHPCHPTAPSAFISLKA